MGRGSRILLSGLLLVVLGLLGWLATLATGGERDGPRGSVGYTVEPPAGWADITRAVSRRTGAAFDVAYGGPTIDGVQVNVNVARSEAKSESLAEVVRAGREELEELGRGSLAFTRPVPTEVDGEAALRYDFTANRTSVRQVGLLRDGDYYVVTLTSARSAFRRSLRHLDAVLRSWRWD